MFLRTHYSDYIMGRGGSDCCVIPDLREQEKNYKRNRWGEKRIRSTAAAVSFIFH